VVSVEMDCLLGPSFAIILSTVVKDVVEKLASVEPPIHTWTDISKLLELDVFDQVVTCHP
jgi:hypothetical protein